MLLSACCVSAAADKTDANAQTVAGKGDYAVVVNAATYAQADWKEVVSALQDKHGASVIVYPGPVRGARDALAKAFPKYACFVARPEEAGQRFVVVVD